MAKQKKLAISSFKHKVVFCSMNDVVIDNQTMSLNRVSALTTWAHIENKSASSYAPNGYAIKPDSEKQTHLITVRARRNIDFSTSAWIYEARLQSAPRWFKILKYSDESETTKFSCRIVERSENATVPTEQNSSLTMPLPQGVKL